MGNTTKTDVDIQLTLNTPTNMKYNSGSIMLLGSFLLGKNQDQLNSKQSYQKPFLRLQKTWDRCWGSPSSRTTIPNIFISSLVQSKARPQSDCRIRDRTWKYISYRMSSLTSFFLHYPLSNKCQNGHKNLEEKEKDFHRLSKSSLTELGLWKKNWWRRLSVDVQSWQRA